MDELLQDRLIKLEQKAILTESMLLELVTTLSRTGIDLEMSEYTDQIVGATLDSISTFYDLKEALTHCNSQASSTDI